MSNVDVFTEICEYGLYKDGCKSYSLLLRFALHMQIYAPTFIFPNEKKLFIKKSEFMKINIKNKIIAL